MICSARTKNFHKSSYRAKLRLGNRGRLGSSLVETLAGFMVLIPIALAAVDVVAFVSAVDNNEHVAETAARGAAKAADQTGAQTIAEDVVKNCTPTWMMQSVMVDDVLYNTGNGTVRVAILMRIKLPVPMPGMSEITCHASSVEPIVFTPAPN